MMKGKIIGSVSTAAAPGSYKMSFQVADSLLVRASTAGAIVVPTQSSSLSIGAIVGIAIGATMFIAAAGAAIYIIHRKWTSGKFHKPLDQVDGEGLYYKF